MDSTPITITLEWMPGWQLCSNSHALNPGTTQRER
jgi:hypothetical protein